MSPFPRIPSRFDSLAETSGPLEAFTSLPRPTSSKPPLPYREPSSISTSTTESSRSLSEATGGYQPTLDVTIHFHKATNLPKLDILGSIDPFFRANIDSQIDYCSACVYNTLNPVWDERWRVRNVPVAAVLSVVVWDKDKHTVGDEVAGKCQTPLTPGRHTLTLTHPKTGNYRGEIHLEIETSPSATNDNNSSTSDPSFPLYSFAGPVRYTVHHSPFVGQLTRTNQSRLYSTWKMHLVGIQAYLEPPTHWNVNYQAAQTIFASSISSAALRESIKAAHRLLYARTWNNGAGVLMSGDEFIALLVSSSENPAASAASASRPTSQSTAATNAAVNTVTQAPIQEVQPTVTGPGIIPFPMPRFDNDPSLDAPQQPTLPANNNAEDLPSTDVNEPGPPPPKPCMYTYAIDDNTLRFSETGAAFMLDNASKHAMHANCSEYIRYAGEFHVRPACGWAQIPPPAEYVQMGMGKDDWGWEVVLDNNSGTYAPPATLLPSLHALIVSNFPGLRLRCVDRQDPFLEQSRKEMQAYAKQYYSPSSMSASGSATAEKGEDGGDGSSKAFGATFFERLRGLGLNR
ncbi:uncharacterized protein EV422DRAFT_319518 [Fimicolochytrium jonesii]|uniref:uncharacterized protein n=1 Tax=Fimicolochytrium jonesii TaxID=1396493 RepID=UPI0022FE35CE|nr:uncharacterized protein EV422DRAFT_319518 [Fimicolochytrium jonesii]KAI8824414.1 hypothetical protein EV422DRAFT_319518 [Fimicolochytrium jonesii]